MRIILKTAEKKKNHKKNQIKNLSQKALTSKNINKEENNKKKLTHVKVCLWFKKRLHPIYHYHLILSIFCDRHCSVKHFDINILKIKQKLITL